jgi:SLBB domain
MRHRLFIALLVVVTVVGGGCCSSVPKHDAASVPPNVGGDYGLFFYVGGEVKYPSRQIMGGRITLLKAIACAGGFAPSANKKKVKLTRHDGEQRIINCTNISRAEEDVDIYPGDHIYVPHSSKWPFW